MTETPCALRSRYQIGDVAWWLHVWEVPGTRPCPTCNGTGWVRIVDSDRKVRCPDDTIGASPDERCQGGRITDRSAMQRRCYIEPRTIGQIRIVVTRDEPPKITYMAEESGIGSGSVLAERNLYPTYEEAVAAAGDAERVPYQDGYR